MASLPMSHSLRFSPFVLLSVALLPFDVREGEGQPIPPPREVPAAAAPRSAAYEWLDIALEATAREHERNGPRPTIGSRQLGIVVTCMYDAWAAYDAKAV